ncbi:uncharacterized protein LOC129233394 [Uloborus diversus]|uniref:uncharacterized protein LOC129233394 n=1 Tax=Uloborus diversus TaxID=327109 RepID=UPI0024096263|nr:uncharacterized protein LOC129233394 [Uloborus diversus]
MSIENFCIVTAIPFHLARLQNSAVHISRTAAMGIREMSCNDNISNQKKKKRDGRSLSEKIQSRKQRNREASVASRQRQKFYEESLKKRIADLQVETAKLLLENKELQTNFSSLESENFLLKKSLEDSGSNRVLDWRDVEETLRHAWFVNIPQLKEWVFTHLFLPLLAIFVESIKINFPVLNTYQLHLPSLLLIWRSRDESPPAAISHPWRMIFSSTHYPMMIS